MPTGIYKASFIKPLLAASFIAGMKGDQLTEWKTKSGKSVNASLHEFALEFIGKPIDRMLRYFICPRVLKNVVAVAETAALAYGSMRSSTETVAIAVAVVVVAEAAT